MNFKLLFQHIKRHSLLLLIKARKVTVPGFDRVPLYDVMLLFFRSIFSSDKGIITTRAAAIAYSLFTAAIPTLIFIISLIPFIPIDNFQNELIQLLLNIIPSNLHEFIEGTLREIFLNPHGNLLSFSFITGVIFATNGIVAMMNAFDASSLVDDLRPWYIQRLIAIGLLFILVIMLTIAISLLTGGQRMINYLNAHDFILSQFNYYLLSVGNWLIIIALFFFTYSFLFYYAPSRKTRYHFISPGGIMSTALSIALFGGFNFYITNFNRYNKLYGSIGTVLIVLLLFYLLAFAILFGFELNTSIAKARNSGRKRLISRKIIHLE
ncbi:MAG: YihY/virulence factor BrkB family protein [Mangrovibacterium sp.]